MGNPGNRGENPEKIDAVRAAVRALEHEGEPGSGFVRLVQGLERPECSELLGSCLMRILLETSSEEIAREVVEGFYVRACRAAAKVRADGGAPS